MEAPQTVELVGELADDYFAFGSLELDMSLALVWVNQLAARASPNDRRADHDLMPLWLAVVVTYGRCFGSGWRAHRARPLRPQTGAAKEDHDWMIEHRDRYVAHLGPQQSEGEVGAVTLVLDRLTEEVAADVIGFRAERWVMPDSGDLDRIRSLVATMELRFEVARMAAATKLQEAAIALGADALRLAAARGDAVRLDGLPAGGNTG